jgi:hypothetical protein
MSAPRAAELPVGSVVAKPLIAWIKAYDDDPEWEGTSSPGGGHLCSNDDIDAAIARGAQVLRVGDGSSR